MVAGSFLAVEVAPDLHRVELPGPSLGYPPPPRYLEFTLRPARRGWTKHALVADPQDDEVLRWLRAIGATEARPAPPRGIKATFERLPPPLAMATSLMQVERVGLGSDGSAFLLARGARGKFRELLNRLEATRIPENAVPELTARQAELLHYCETKGYYQIPRQVTLRDLAADLGISPTALSLALRRAEARILTAYVERLRSSLPLDGRTPTKKARKPKA